MLEAKTLLQLEVRFKDIVRKKYYNSYYLESVAVAKSGDNGKVISGNAG
jgi:hypothetical protein